MIYTLSLHDALPISRFFVSSIALYFVNTILKVLQQFFIDRKSTRLNSSHVSISYAVFCLKKKNKTQRFHVSCQLDKLKSLKRGEAQYQGMEHSSKGS